MASKKPAQPVMPKPRLIATKAGSVHVVTTERWDKENSTCRVVKRGWTQGTWKGKRGVSPDAALAHEPCDACKSHTVARRIKRESQSPEERRAESKDKRDQTLAKARGEQQWYVSRDHKGFTTNPDMAAKGDDGEPIKGSSGTSKKRPRATRGPTTVGGKVVKQGSASVKRSGRTMAARKGAGTAEGSEGKARELVAYATEQGWEATVEPLEGTEYVVTATKGKETVTCYFIDGKYNRDRHSTVAVGEWTGRLRGVHGCRKQIGNAGSDRPFPDPGSGRSAVSKRRKAEADEPDPETEHVGLPFTMDAPDGEIIEAVRGHHLKWRNTLSDSVQAAEVPGKRGGIKLSTHPKRDVRVLSFFEVVYDERKVAGLGGERNVAIDRIIRVV